MKVLARIGTHQRKPTTPGGYVHLMVEYLFTDGSKPPGKYEQAVLIENERQVEHDLKDGLAAHLSALHTPLLVRPRDIVGCGL